LLPNTIKLEWRQFFPYASIINTPILRTKYIQKNNPAVETTGFMLIYEITISVKQEL